MALAGVDYSSIPPGSKGSRISPEFLRLGFFARGLRIPSKFQIALRSVSVDNLESGTILADFKNIEVNSLKGFVMKQRCNCVQGAILRQTGWSGDHPEWYCPVCKKEYYVEKDGLITSERPFKKPIKQESNA